MAYYPDPNLFNKAFGGGVGIGSGLADLVRQRQQRSHLAELAQLAQQGDYSGLGAGLIAQGQVGAGINALGVPYAREQDAAQRAFQREQFGANQDYRNRSFEADQAYRNAQLGMDRERLAIARENAARKAQDDASFNKSPTLIFNPDTQQYSYAQFNDRGEVKETPLPQGYRPAPTNSFLDLGTARQLFDTRTGQAVAAPVAIDVSGEKAAQETGKARGEAQASFESMAAKMPGLEQVVSQLDGLAERATYTYAGQALDAARKQFGAEPRDAAIARTQYIAVVDNQILPLLRDTFGAAFTVKEGETLRATLGDPNKSPQEKQVVLRSFIEQKRRDMEASARQSGSSPARQNGSDIESLLQKYGQ